VSQSAGPQTATVARAALWTVRCVFAKSKASLTVSIFRNAVDFDWNDQTEKGWLAGGNIC